MDSTTYSYLHKLPKDLNSVRGDILYCAKFGQQKPSEHFKIIQNRKGHRRKDNLSYLLLHGNNQPMIWVDINGQTHHGIPTPHAHVFTDGFTNGEIAIPIDRLSKHLSSTQVVSSFLEFLKYNNFNTNIRVVEDPN